jgi:hypothetical protein
MALFKTIGKGIKGLLTPAANSPANGVNVGDVVKSSVLPVAVVLLSNAGLFLPATGPWIAAATFALHLIQLYAPAGPVTIPPGATVHAATLTEFGYVADRPPHGGTPGADY